jgi:hypothetical protein
MKASTGARKTWLVNRVVRNWGPKSAILSLTSDANTVYGSGYAYQGGNFEGVFAASPADGAIRWLQDCHGDTYSVAPVGDVVYSANHAHYCSNIGGFPDTSPRVHHHALAVTKAATGTVATNGQPGAHYGNFGGQPAPALFNWFPDFTPGSYTGLSQATWSVAGGRGYVVYGGEFTRVNGVAQQGLVRFAVPSLAPRESGPMDRRPLSAPWVTANRAGGADVTWPANWDRDDLTLSYLLRRDQTELATLSASAPFWKRPLLTRTDAGLSAGPTYRYEFTATDPDGNAWTSASTEFRTSGYAPEVRADGATHQWRLDSRPGSSADRDQAGASALNLSRQIALGTRGALRPETSAGATLSGSAAVAGRSVESESPSPRTTLEVWFRTTTAGGTLVAFGSGDAGRPTTRSHELYLTPTGRLSFAVRGSGATGADAVFAATTGPVTDGAWHHAAAVQATGELRLYLDGSLAATKSGTVPVGSAGRWWVGGATPADLVNAAKTAYAGDLDEVAVYPAALSGPALADHVAIGRG